jgi:phosphohistidine swiveling domain-containing protein
VALRALLARLDDLAVRRQPKDRALLRALRRTRHVAVEMDRRLTRLEARPRPGGVFLCDWRSLEQALEKDSEEIGRLVQVRQAGRALGIEPPAPQAARPAMGGQAGIGACPGIVEGRVHIASPTEPPIVDPGRVLVAARVPITWGGLLRHAAAVVSEHDRLLSPAAELARSLGVPMVCGLAGATTGLGPGELVRIDGSRGTVERLGSGP